MIFVVQNCQVQTHHKSRIKIFPKTWRVQVVNLPLLRFQFVSQINEKRSGIAHVIPVTEIYAANVL